MWRTTTTGKGLQGFPARFKKAVYSKNFLRCVRRGSLITTTSMGMADILCQTLEQHKTLNLDDAIVLDADFDWDWERSMRMATCGFLVAGPHQVLQQHTWEALFPKTAGSVRRVLCQTFYAPVAISATFTTLLLLEGKSFRSIRKKLRHDLLPTYASGFFYWPPILLINHRFVPLSARPQVSSVASSVWHVFMSYMAHKEPEQAHPSFSISTPADGGAPSCSSDSTSTPAVSSVATASSPPSPSPTPLTPTTTPSGASSPLRKRGGKPWSVVRREAVEKAAKEQERVERQEALEARTREREGERESLSGLVSLLETLKHTAFAKAERRWTEEERDGWRGAGGNKERDREARVPGEDGGEDGEREGEGEREDGQEETFATDNYYFDQATILASPLWSSPSPSPCCTEETAKSRPS